MSITAMTAEQLAANWQRDNKHCPRCRAANFRHEIRFEPDDSLVRDGLCMPDVERAYHCDLCGLDWWEQSETRPVRFYALGGIAPLGMSDA